MNDVRKDKIILFSLGALGYGFLEILWRGYTHWSMLTAGGICFMGFAKIGERFKNVSLILKGLIGSGFVTATEFIFGIVFNVILKKNVWDYSKMPLNLCGQVCALYSFFWVIISMFFIPFACFINKKLKKI